MGYKSDIEIAQECTMQPITAIAEKAGIDEYLRDNNPQFVEADGKMNYEP